MSNDFRRFLLGMADAGAFLGVIFTVAGFFGRFHYFIEIFTHLKLALALCFAGYISLKLLLGNRRIAALALLPLLINAVPPLLLLLPQQRQEEADGPVAVRILQSNLLTSNRRADKLLELVEQVDPEIIVLQETNRRWLFDLAVLKERYPVFAEHPREDNFGAAIFCRNTNAVATIEFLDDPDALPLSKVVYTSGSKRITVYGAHPLAPVSPYLWKWRNEYTLQLAAKLANEKGAVVVTGDLNNTPWAYYYKQFKRISGLLDSSQGRGPLPTWPAGRAVLPLDHCFHSEDVLIRRRERGPHIGSDHYPLIIEAVF